MTTLEEFLSYHRRKFKTKKNWGNSPLWKTNFSERYLTSRSLCERKKVLLPFFRASKLTVSKAQRFSNRLLIEFTIYNTNNSKFEGYFTEKTFIKRRAQILQIFAPKTSSATKHLIGQRVTERGKTRVARVTFLFFLGWDEGMWHRTFSFDLFYPIFIRKGRLLESRPCMQEQW